MLFSVITSTHLNMDYENVLILFLSVITMYAIAQSPEDRLKA